MDARHILEKPKDLPSSELFDWLTRTKIHKKIAQHSNLPEIISSFTQLQTQIAARWTSEDAIKGCLFVALKIKNTIATHIHDFSDLIQLPSPVIAALLGYPSDMLKRYIKTPTQMEKLLRTLMPSVEMEIVIESMDLRWFRKLFDGKDLVVDANQLDSFISVAIPGPDHTAFLNNLDHRWIMKLYHTKADSNLKSRINHTVKWESESAVHFFTSNKRDQHHDNHTFFRQPHLEEIMQGQTRNNGLHTAEVYASTINCK